MQDANGCPGLDSHLRGEGGQATRRLVFAKSRKDILSVKYPPWPCSILLLLECQLDPQGMNRM